MKRMLCFMFSLVLLMSAFTLTTNNVNAKSLKLKPKYYICYGNSHCKVKLTKKKLSLKKFDICPERDGWFVLKNGNTTLQLEKNCKFYKDMVRVSFKKAKKILKKKPKSLYSFKINGNNRISEITYELF